MAKIPIYGYEFDEEAWRRREGLEFALLDKVYSGADLSDLRVLDGDTGVGYSAKYLALRVKGGFVVTVDIDPRAFEMLTNLMAGKSLNEYNIQFVRGDLRELGFIRDGCFDVVNLHFTVHTVESTTPGGTLQVLEGAYRVLRPGGTLVITENYPTFKPVDRAQELLIELSRIEEEIMEALGAARRDVEYEPDELAGMLVRVGFSEVSYTKISDGEMDPTLLDWALYLIKRAHEIKGSKEGIVRRIEEKLNEARIYGIRGSPSYAIYALK